MLVTNHVLAGAIIGAVTRRPAVAFAAGLASHFVMDAIPHWGSVDRSTFLKVAVCDGLTGLGVIAAVSCAGRGPGQLALLAAMAGAAAPDLNKPGQLFFGRSPFPAGLDRFHARIQRESPDRMVHEFLAGAVLGMVAWALVRRASARARAMAQGARPAPPSPHLPVRAPALEHAG